jgi:hypothetical protein
MRESNSTLALDKEAKMKDRFLNSRTIGFFFAIAASAAASSLQLARAETHALTRQSMTCQGHAVDIMGEDDPGYLMNGSIEITDPVVSSLARLKGAIVEQRIKVETGLMDASHVEGVSEAKYKGHLVLRIDGHTDGGDTFIVLIPMDQVGKAGKGIPVTTFNTTREGQYEVKFQCDSVLL